jgi:hypothetical protein
MVPTSQLSCMSIVCSYCNSCPIMYHPLFLALVAGVTASPTSSSWETGFSNPITSTSRGGKAVCITGNVAVTATSNKLILALPIAANLTVVAQTLVDIYTAGSTFSTYVVKGNNQVKGTFNINAQL